MRSLIIYLSSLLWGSLVQTTDSHFKNSVKEKASQARVKKDN